MSVKLKFVLYLGISLYVVFNQCQVSEAQNLYELSYGQEVLPPVTPQPSTTTTKKSSFFKGIKKWFKGETTTTTTSTTPSTVQLSGSVGSSQSQSNTVSSPRPPQQAPSPSSGSLANRDFINTNTRPRSPTLPLPVTPSSPIHGITGSGATYPSQAPANRDFVNPNAKPGNLVPSSTPLTPTGTVSGITPPTPRNNVMQPSQPPMNVPSRQGISSFPTPTGSTIGTYPQGSGNRDFVNPNPRPTGSPVSPTGTPPSVNGQRISQPPRRDYVNTNIGPGANNTPSPHSTSTRIATNPTQPSNGQRDFVNTSPRPSSFVPQPMGATGPWASTPQPSSGQRDFVNSNPNINPQRNDKEFPALPVPGRPPSPTRQTSNPASPQRQPNANPSNPTGVSFIPRQPSSGRVQSTTAKTTELATDEEITTLTETLFTKDVNNQNRHITVNYQGKTRSSDRTDEAPNPLLQINEEALQSPTVAKMRPLFNNYELDTTVNEYVTPLERKEENELLDAVLATTVMRQAMLFLQNKGIVTPDPKTHRDLLKTIWFTMYSRGGGRIGSSAFEHVFLSEVKNGTITGLHNWVYYFEEEQLGHIDYKGYIKKLDLGNKGAVIKFRFNFNGIEKPVNSMFIGTSPELEMALYTVCFQLRPDRDCPISIGGSTFTIQTYTFRYRGKNLIGSAFPEI